MSLRQTGNIAFIPYPFGSSLKTRAFSVGSGFRFGFNGKEKENNFIANEYTFEFRIYNSGLGRFLSNDPLSYKYPWLSTYCFAANLPIRLVDILGLGPGDVVVAFGGGDWAPITDKGLASTIIQRVNSRHINQAGGSSRAYASQYWGISPDNVDDLNKATQEAYDFIKTNHKVEGGKVIIEGYSFGGVLANHLSKRLEADKIQVDLLITVDAAAAIETDEVDRTISANVKKNINIYQTNASFIGSRGAANKSKTKSTLILNDNYTGFFKDNPEQSDFEIVSHDNIDDITENRIVNEIVNVLGDIALPNKMIESPIRSSPRDNTNVAKPIIPVKIK